ncbi:flagellar type III secretion system protein FlhB [Tropicimonas sp.]|uniref:flagellar type III secretion system protein FlhB n=1 Tax=Tropicimonas sp. TaxID=2067044 RepID=UPI003A8B3ED5
MAAEQDDNKQHEPSQKKLDDARKKGEIPKSNDISVAVSYAGFLLVAATFGGGSVSGLGGVGLSFIDPVRGFRAAFIDRMTVPPSFDLLAQLGRLVLPALLLPAIAVLASLLFLRALVFVPDKLRPRFSRISPLSNAKNKFGRSGLFEFCKSAAKLVLISGIMAMFLWRNAEQLVGATMLPHLAVATRLGRLAVEFLSILVVLFGLIGAIDHFWQVAEHRRRNRMSQKELRDEIRESEGDPHMKQSRRRRAQEIALNSMLSEVPAAAVVVVNPEHYAVALKWETSFSGAPICVAKGVDEIAARIREIASENGVPIHRDPPFARELHATTDPGDEIRPEHYRAAAAAIRFAERMRKIARGKMTERTDAKPR